jgi:hypothetical protein
VEADSSRLTSLKSYKFKGAFALNTRRAAAAVDILNPRLLLHFQQINNGTGIVINSMYDDTCRHFYPINFVVAIDSEEGHSVVMHSTRRAASARL